MHRLHWHSELVFTCCSEKPQVARLGGAYVQLEAHCLGRTAKPLFCCAQACQPPGACKIFYHCCILRCPDLNSLEESQTYCLRPELSSFSSFLSAAAAHLGGWVDWLIGGFSTADLRFSLYLNNTFYSSSPCYITSLPLRGSALSLR